MSLLGNSAVIPLGDFSTVYQVQEQLSRTIGRHIFKSGAEFRRIQSTAGFWGKWVIYVPGSESFRGSRTQR